MIFRSMLAQQKAYETCRTLNAMIGKLLQMTMKDRPDFPRTDMMEISQDETLDESIIRATKRAA
jgi:hypothetical protein